MTESIQESPSQIESEAVAWLMKLDSDTASENDLEDFQLWIGANPLNAYHFHRLSKIWDTAADLLPLAEHYPHKVNKSVATEQPKRWFSFQAPWVAGGFVAAGLLMLAVLIPPRHIEQHERMTLETAIGEQRTFNLPDGSSVNLNTRSRISVDYTANKRTLVLEYGEGNFKVAKNKTRPFLVMASKGAVMAVGTEFVVRYTSPAVNVYVSEGVVKVLSKQDEVDKEFSNKALIDRKGEVAIVRAGQGTSYSTSVSPANQLTESEREKRSSWMSGALVLNGESLDTAVGEFSRYTDKHISIADEAIKSMRVGGRYQTNNIDGVLQSLGKSLNIKVSYPDDKTILLSR